MSAHHHVVSDLHQVVDLGAVPDARAVGGGAVDGGVGADLDVVADHHVAHLRHLVIAAAVEREAEAVAADHHPRMHDAALADLALVAQDHMREEEGVVAHRGALAHVAPRHQHHAGSDLRPALDHALGADRHLRADLRLRRDHRARVHAGLGPVGIGPKHAHHALKRQVGVVDLQQRNHRGAARLARADHRRGAGLEQVGLVARVGEEGDVAGKRLADSRHPADRHRPIPHHLAAEDGGQLGQSLRDHERPSYRAPPVVERVLSSSRTRAVMSRDLSA